MNTSVFDFGQRTVAVVAVKSRDLTCSARPLAHSLGNVVAGEALRQWVEDGHTAQNDPLVVTYVASQAAISGGFYDSGVEYMANYDKAPIVDNIPLPPNLDSPSRDPFPPDVYKHYWKSGNDGQHPATWSDTNIPYLEKAFVQSAATRWSNFYNRNDYALSGLFELGNRFKPAKIAALLVGIDDHRYNYSAADGFYAEYGGYAPPPAIPFTEFLVDHTKPLAFPTDRFEIFAFAAPTYSRALGTYSEAGVFASARATNLASSDYGFGNEHRWHSGQFRSYNAVRYKYWMSLLDAALIPHINPQP